MEQKLVEQLEAALQESLGARTQLLADVGDSIQVRGVDYKAILPAAMAFFKNARYIVREASPFFFVAKDPSGKEYWVTRRSRTLSVRDSPLPQIEAERHAYTKEFRSLSMFAQRRYKS